MQITKVETTPFDDQRPGTSGLRKKTKSFMQPHYLQNFIQSVFDALRSESGESFDDKALVVGGDGRYYNRSAIQTIIRMAAANGFGRVIVGCTGVVSTPAVSAMIRRNNAFGGFVLSASHNPGGIEEDFGVKYNATNGGPAPAALTERIYEISRNLTHYLTCDAPEVDIQVFGSERVGSTEVCVVDPLKDYVEVMQELFDFEALRQLFKSGFAMKFDAMNAATGPYATYILEQLLGAEEGTVMRNVPLEDFGGAHPDPNQVHAHELICILNGENAPQFGAASDGDGDRNLILGPGFYVTPGDSVAIIAEHAAQAIPGYRQGLAGAARSMPTSTALDRVADSLGVPCYETPTGWKFFGSLMDAGKCTICGEESFGTGSDHVREKDGVWAVLAWLSILAHTGKSVEEVVHDHWKKFGRSYYQRHDHENLPKAKAESMFEELRLSLPSLAGQPFAGRTVSLADDFSYTDPIDGSTAAKQGVRILLDDGSRVVCRLSGTGTEGATLRIYLESYNKDDVFGDPHDVLRPLAEQARQMLGLKAEFGSDEPTVIT